MKSFINKLKKKKVAVNEQANPIAKYIKQEHWHQLKANYQNKPEEVINLGLQFENNINHTGDALLLFYAFYVMRDEHYLQKKRQLAELFCTSDILDGFEKVDRQYLLDMAALSLRMVYGDVTQEDAIHKVTKLTPNPEGVNPLLTQVFWVKAETAISYTLDEESLSLIDWYIINLQNLAISDKPYIRNLIVLATNFKQGTSSAENLKFIAEALHPRATDPYIAGFVVSEEERERDSWAVPRRLAQIRTLIESILDKSG